MYPDLALHYHDPDKANVSLCKNPILMSSAWFWVLIVNQRAIVIVLTSNSTPPPQTQSEINMILIFHIQGI